MNKKLIVIISVLLAVVISVTSFIIYKVNTPEYVIVKTISDVRSDGLDGLHKHLTDDAWDVVESVDNFTDDISRSNILSSVISGLTKEYGASLLKSKISEIDWSVEDVMSGKKNADVIIRFDYQGDVSGTISVKMIKENHKWKISGIGIPSFDKFFSIKDK